MRATVPRAASRSQGSASGSGQQGTSAARGGQTETSRGPRIDRPKRQTPVAH